tara:strand:+ start:200 stop:1207 length:1008 start_codon:yes stop_codon:yes gene_type:complete
MKRTLGHSSTESIEEEFFDINKYKITDLQSLIDMIEDFKYMPLPKRSKRKNLPVKIYLLPDLLPELKELNELIGMKTLKSQVLDQILFFIQGVDDNIMLHTVLEGPPGTGKTTVARIMANIYSKLGIFKKPKFNIVKRADLISEYLGGTAIKTLETLDRCKNGVMLIDEAYSLGSQSGQDDMFSKECLDTLNEYLSENFMKIICIIAGYKKELNNSFFSANPGLKRRFPWTFTLDKYNSSELAKIFIKQVNEKEWETEMEEECISKLIYNHVQLFDGNGGDISTIIDKCIIINVRNNFGKDNLYNISIEDFKEALSIFVNNKKEKQDSPPFNMYT